LKLLEAEKRAQSKEIWPRIKSVITCSWLCHCKSAKRSRKVPEVRFHISPEQTANKSARSYGHGGEQNEYGGYDESKAKKSVRMVTSTPLMPQKQKKMPTLTSFDSSPLTGGEIAYSDVEAEDS